jgi:hypothetical protein
VTATITFLPASEKRISDYLEDLAREHNSGWDATGEARPMCPLIGDEDFPIAWADFCQAVADRDAVAPPGTRHWTEVLGEDCVSTQDEAYEVLCERADEALLILMTGLRGTR